jgi:hypothetical protein
MKQRTSMVITGLNTEIFVQQHCGLKLPHRQSWACKPVNAAYHMGNGGMVGHTECRSRRPLQMRICWADGLLDTVVKHFHYIHDICPYPHYTHASYTPSLNVLQIILCNIMVKQAWTCVQYAHRFLARDTDLTYSQSVYLEQLQEQQ